MQRLALLFAILFLSFAPAVAARRGGPIHTEALRPWGISAPIFDLSVPAEEDLAKDLTTSSNNAASTAKKVKEVTKNTKPVKAGTLMEEEMGSWESSLALDSLVLFFISECFCLLWLLN